MFIKLLQENNSLPPSPSPWRLNGGPLIYYRTFDNGSTYISCSVDGLPYPQYENHASTEPFYKLTLLHRVGLPRIP